MRDIAVEVVDWLASGASVAIALVVETSGSGPRPVGTAMAVSADGRIAGNVSAGCVDGAVVTAAQQALAGATASVLDFGISDEQALSAGLTCGGDISVLVSPLDASDASAVAAVATAVAAGEPVALAVVTGGMPARVGALLAVSARGTQGDIGHRDLQRQLTEAASQMLDESAASAPIAFGGEDVDRQGQSFVTVLTPPPRMLVFGANDVAAALAQMGAFLKYRVTVCDARAAFVTPQRFPSATEVIVEWPHRFLARTAVDASTVICVLTHDPKFDVPVLAAAVQTPAGYIGMLGSRRTGIHRLEQLRREGVGEADLARIRTPIGLKLGGRSPEETAVAIAAEIIALRHGASGEPLRGGTGAIHAERVS